MGVKGYDPNEKYQPQGELEIRVSYAEKTKEQEKEKETPKTAPNPKLAPRTFHISKVAEAEKPVEALYEEHLERLEQVIEEQTQQVVEEVQQIAEKHGLDPSDVTLVGVWDITGKDQIKCVYCGRPTCTFRPQIYRVKNPEIDLIGDSITVFQEAASRAGAKYAMMVYDDQDVLVLREPNVAADQDERAQALSRYTEFRDRIQYPDYNSRGWMDEMLQKWTPDQQFTRKTGDPLDQKALETTFKVFDAAGGALKMMMMVKSLPPKMGFRGVEVQGKAKGIAMTGVAVGRQAEYIAPRLFTNTLVAPDLHEVRERMGAAIAEGAKQLEEMNQ
jgi:hypothetical protein